MLVYVEGKLTHRKWVDKEGRDHYTTEITADVLKILEKEIIPHQRTPTLTQAPKKKI